MQDALHCLGCQFQWEWDGNWDEIVGENENGHNLVIGIGWDGNRNKVMGIGDNRNHNVIPAHLYSSVLQYRLCMVLIAISW